MLITSDYKQNMEYFIKEVGPGNDAEIRARTAGISITLEHHLKKAESAEKLIKDKNC